MYGSESVFNYPASMTSSVSQTSDSASASPVSKPYATLDSQDVLSFSGQGKKKSQGVMGAVKDFGKGVVKGAYNAVASLFTVKGMAMAVGSLICVAVAPAVAVPLLATVGVVMGGKQIAEGATTGDWEKAGEGTFTLGATMLGAKFGPKTVKGAGDAEYSFVSSSTKDGVTTASKPTGILGSAWANIKAVFGGKMGKLDKDGNIMTTADGKLVDGKNIYQLTKEKFSKSNENAADSSANASTASSTVNSSSSSMSTVAPKSKTTSSTVNSSSSSMSTVAPKSKTTSSTVNSSYSSMSMATPAPKVEVARIQELQNRASGALSAEEALELKALEAKYPHHNAEAVKTRKEIAELKDLHEAQTKGELDPANRPRLDELREQYYLGDALIERRHLDRIQAARTNFEDLKLPEGYEDWTIEHQKGPDAFNHILDLEEFESLHALRSNPAEEFTAADQTRYTALKQQLELKKNEIDQKWWINKTRAEVKQQKDIKKMLNAPDPEVVNPTGWSVADLDRMSAQPELAVKHLEALQRKELQQQGSLTATEKTQMQALEDRFPHRSLENILQRREISEMADLYQQEAKGPLGEEAQERLAELKEVYPDQFEVLDNQRFISQIRSMRADFNGADLPPAVRAEWKPDYDKGTSIFNYELDIHELESLNELRSNETYQFTEADHTHYDQVRQRIQDLHDAEKPKWFKDGNFDIKRMTDALEPVGVKTPSPESQMSLKELDKLVGKPKVTIEQAETTELSNLFWRQTDGKTTRVQAARLEELSEKYPEAKDALDELRALDKIANERAINALPEDMRNVFEGTGVRPTEELDIREFESLKALRANQSFTFGGEHMQRYDQLETALKGRLDQLEAESDPDFFSKDWDLEREIHGLRQLLNPQDTVNPSSEEFARVSKPAEKKATTKEDGDISDDESDDEFFEFDDDDFGESVPAAPAAKKENVQDKDKKWYSGFSGPQGAGQIFSTIISGSLTGDEPS